MNQTLARSINTSLVAILPGAGRSCVIGAQLLGATTLQSYGLALFVGLLSGAYSSIFIASPVVSMMKEREDRGSRSPAASRNGARASGSYSALDAATMSTQMSVAASGQVSRGAAAPKSRATKRSGPIRPGSGSGAGAGSSGSGGSGTGTAVMDRPADGSSGGQGQAQGPRPRNQEEEATPLRPAGRRVTFVTFPAFPRRVA